MERLVANLVHNALRHNQPGGWARVGTGTRGPQAVLSVVNSGPPVEAGDTGRLFQPFQRLDDARSRQNGGHGLGLAIVKAVAVAHGATVATRARPEGGLAIEVGFQAAWRSRPRSLTPAGPCGRSRRRPWKCPLLTRLLTRRSGVPSLCWRA